MVLRMWLCCVVWKRDGDKRGGVDVGYAKFTPGLRSASRLARVAR